MQSALILNVNGQLVTVAAAVAATPFTYVNSLKFDAFGRIVVH